jgi:hypothetical protein
MALGIVLYGIIWIPAYIFYSSLGITPSEVGINYTSVISSSAIVAITLIALFFILVYPFILAVHFLVALAFS